MEHYTRQADGTWNYAAVEGTEAASIVRVQGVALSLAEIYDRITFEENISVRGTNNADTA